MNKKHHKYNIFQGEKIARAIEKEFTTYIKSLVSSLKNIYVEEKKHASSSRPSLSSSSDE